MHQREVYRRWQTVRKQRRRIEVATPHAPVVKRLREVEAGLFAQVVQSAGREARKSA